jgi:hypothetical protein
MIIMYKNRATPISGDKATLIVVITPALAVVSKIHPANTHAGLHACPKIFVYIWSSWNQVYVSMYVFDVERGSG